MSKKERLVAAIENGTVIDHIPAEKAYAVAITLLLYTAASVAALTIHWLTSRCFRGCPGRVYQASL